MDRRWRGGAPSANVCSTVDVSVVHPVRLGGPGVVSPRPAGVSGGGQEVDVVAKARFVARGRAPAEARRDEKAMGVQP